MLASPRGVWGLLVGWVRGVGGEWLGVGDGGEGEGEEGLPSGELVGNVMAGLAAGSQGSRARSGGRMS